MNVLWTSNVFLSYIVTELFLVEQRLSSSNIVSNNENNTITPTENNVVVTESDNSYSEVGI